MNESHSVGKPELAKQLSLEVDESLFPFEVVLKSVYWLSGRFSVEVTRPKEGRLQVLVRPIDDQATDWNSAELEHRIRRDLIDFRTRVLIDQETRTIREILVAKAFDDSQN